MEGWEYCLLAKRVFVGMGLMAPRMPQDRRLSFWGVVGANVPPEGFYGHLEA